MKRLWAPWRMAYVAGTRRPAGCLFCVKPNARRDADNLILFRGRHAFVMMNRFPYNSGHLMVAPYAHDPSLDALSEEATLDLFSLVRLALQALRREAHPDGFNLGINLGRVAGAGIAEHVHLHIVPRWNGDTNFMPLLAETRVIPEHLERTYRKLRARFHVLAPAAPHGSVGRRSRATDSETGRGGRRRP